MISPFSCHANTILDHILTQMDEKGISDKKLRKAVAKVKEESVPTMKEDAMNNGLYQQAKLTLPPLSSYQYKHERR